MEIIGHRGARGLAPENTLASFKKAQDIGVDWIEFDVRISKDDIPLVHHDTVLTDASGNRLAISKYIYADLKKHKADLVTLEEALVFIKGAVKLYIEVKPGVKIEPIINTLAGYKHSYVVGSKSQKTLIKLHKALPKIRTIVIESWSGVKARWRAHQLNTNLIAMNQNFLWSGFIRLMSKAGYELWAYTLNDPIKAKHWAERGLAGAITDYPDRFKQP